MDCLCRHSKGLYFYERKLSQLLNIHSCQLHIKGAQVWDFRPIFFYISKSYMGRWLEDWRKKIFVRRLRQIFAILVFCACWACAKKLPTHAEPALKIACAGWACAKNLKFSIFLRTPKKTTKSKNFQISF